MNFCKRVALAADNLAGVEPEDAITDAYFWLKGEKFSFRGFSEQAQRYLNEIKAQDPAHPAIPMIEKITQSTKSLITEMDQAVSKLS